MQPLIVTAAQMKALEHAADSAGLSYRQMMENAGQAAFAAIRQTYPQHDTAVVFAGKGNNGGDGFVVARLLAAAGKRVRVILCEGQPVTPDAQYNLGLLSDIPVLTLESLTEAQQDTLLRSDIIVDALYGTGFHGGLRPSGLHAAELINRANGQVCALDLPSGINADTGAVAQGAVWSDLTITFHARKQGQSAPAAAAHCGTIQIVDIGITAALRSNRVE